MQVAFDYVFNQFALGKFIQSVRQSMSFLNNSCTQFNIMWLVNEIQCTVYITAIDIVFILNNVN